MTLLWVGLGAALVLIVGIVSHKKFRADDDAALGSVSTQWVTEHRLGPRD